MTPTTRQATNWKDGQLHRIISVFARAASRGSNLGFPTVTAFVVVDLVLVVVCLLLLRQNLALGREVTRSLALLAPADGTVMPPLVGVDRAGVAHEVGYGVDLRPTLVYAFSRGCGSCEQSWTAVRPLQALAPHTVRIVYLHTSGDAFTPEYLSATGIGQSVVLVELAANAPLLYDARAVPQLLLVDANRRLRWSHVGEVKQTDVSVALSVIERLKAEPSR